jgi:hypothetical protein
MTCVGPLTEQRPVAKCAGRPSLTLSGHAEVERNFFIVIALPRLRSRQDPSRVGESLDGQFYLGAI